MTVAESHAIRATPHICKKIFFLCKFAANIGDTRPIKRLLLSALKVWKLACPKGSADLVFPSRTGGVEHHRLMSSGLHAVIAAVGPTDHHGEPKYGLHAFPHYFASRYHQS
jgi:integrase